MSANDAARSDGEPVDAEFEPVKPARPRRSGGTGAALRLLGLVLLASLLGGISGYGAARWMPTPGADADADAALEPRIAALEAAPAPDLTSEIAPLSRRLTSVEDAAEAASALAPRLAALRRDVDALAARLDDLPADPASGASVDTDALAALEDRLAAVASDAEAALSAAQQTQSALAVLPSDGDGDGGGADLVRLEALAARLDALEAALADLSALGALEERIAALETHQIPPNPTTDSPAAAALADRALAFAALSQVASTSDPFAVELETLRRVWPQAPGLAALTPIARSGAPTAERLQDSLPLDSLKAATGETRTYFGVLHIDRAAGSGPAAALAAALAAGDLDEAAILADALIPEAASVIAPWRAGLDRRLAVRRALDAQAADLAREGDQP